MKIILTASILNLIILNAESSGSTQIERVVQNKVWKDFDTKLFTVFIDNRTKILHDNTELSVPKSDCVKGLVFEKNKNIKFLPVNVSKAYPYLNAYFATEINILHLQYKHLNNLDELQSLYLLRSAISTISKDAFKDLTNLKQLILYGNILKVVGRYTFHSLKNLRSLNLQDKQIETVSTFAFKNLKELQEISLSNNKLTSWNESCFSENKKLEKILMSNNKIKVLSEKSFESNKNLKFISLVKNECINESYEAPKFKLMKEKIKSNCKEKSAMKNLLEIVDLSKSIYHELG